MLILFDIDATLLVSSRSGVYAMQDAGRELFGSHFVFEGVDFAGRLDPLILRDLFSVNKVEPTADNFEAMRWAYGEHLRRRIAVPNTARALPGVHALLDALRPRTDLTLGLLTGNFAETGSLKLRAVGIDPDDFPIQAWGDLSPHNPPSRDHLVPVAFEQVRRLSATAQRLSSNGSVDPRRVLVIGDTPHDVQCAKAHNCRSLAVATGLHSVELLRSTGADHVVSDLSDTAAIMEFIFSYCPSS
jgi:phosphoglycolate phosphatase